MPFEKGKSGNPATQFKPGNPGGGRPCRDHVTRHLREFLESPAARPTGRKIAKILLEMALKRNMQAIREIMDRVEGRPAISIGGVPGEPIKFAGDRIPPGLTNAEMHEYTDKRIIEILRGWMDRCGYELLVRKKKGPRNNKENLDDILARQKYKEPRAV
jgi:hypothetical protein